MARYEPVIGLEVHAQLKTATKIFCSCSTKFGNEPNENVCPVCSGMPGVLPVLNEKVVEYAAKMGLAVECAVNRESIFARKHYYYPDLPKNYQISQYEQPICEHGRLVIELPDGARKTIGITRIHMEEDAGKSIHSASENVSYVDLNRTGTPLIEIVSEPDIRSADEAVAYLKALRQVLLYLGICDGNMEEGSFRCDANVSIRPVGQREFGTRTELKNLNSFKFVHKAIEYEIERQTDVLDDGERVVQETRLFDSARGITMSMRGKEEAHDYRYFPDPDLVPVRFDVAMLEKWGTELPELPKARKARFMADYDLPEQDAEVLTAERELADYYEAAVRAYRQPKKIANWVLTELLRELNVAKVTPGACPMMPEALAKLVAMIDDGSISTKIGKQVFPDIFSMGVADPAAYCKEKGFVQISDTDALETAVDEVIAANPAEAERFKAGEKKLMSFFMGQVMRATKGQANPKLVTEMITTKIGG